jgi:hypothetical protein
MDRWACSPTQHAVPLGSDHRSPPAAAGDSSTAGLTGEDFSVPSAALEPVYIL